MDNEESQPESVASAQKKEQLKNRVLKQGESFGNYRVVKCLCVGLIAHYYHMQHIRDLHDVTVAVFHHRTSEDDKFFKRLEILKKSIESVNHESLPKILDCSQIKERCCLFLEPVKGHSLSQYFDAHGDPGKSGLEPKIAMRVIAQLLGALGYVHSQGLDHRDLDSDLIFIQEDGTVRILGVGVKAALGVELFESIVSASVSPLVSSKTVGRLNSFDIMSPEYKSGVAEDSRVDVYCTGVIGYWLLTAQKPDLANYEPPTKLVQDISPKWNTFFDKSLQRLTDERYQSCKVALLGLKDTEEEPESEGAGFVQRQIDRIPVPKGIVDRGALAARIYRLSVIGLVGLTLTALAASFLQVSYTEEQDYTRDVAQLAPSPESASVELSVKPPVAKVEFIGYNESFVANRGALALSVQPGNYKLRVSAPHHIEQIVELKIAIEAASKKSLQIDLKPAWTDIEIRTEPYAAISVIDARDIEIELGVADEAGVFLLRKGIFAGTYNVLVKKEGYQPNTLTNQSIDFGELAQIEAPLTPLPASVTIHTEPSGARILVNEIDVGISPLVLDEVIPSDQYLIVAHLEGYRSMGRRVEVVPGAALEVDFGVLTPRSGAVAVSVLLASSGQMALEALYADLVVQIGEEQFAYGSRELENIPVGEYRIQLNHPQYFSDPVELVVEDRGNYRPELMLKPRPGTIQLNIPGGLDAEIRINRQAAQLKDGAVNIPAYEEVELELRIRNHLTMMQHLKLEPNEQIVWDVEPVPIPGPTIGQSWTLPYFGVQFSWVPAGKFMMGSPLPEHARLPNEGPLTPITFSQGFWAGSYEVTQSQYAAITDTNPSQFKSSARPVDGVSWEEAKLFCDLLNNFERAAGRLPEGYAYRLPTEPEWEYAARGGAETAFHFGNLADASEGNFRGVYPRDREDGLRSPDSYGTGTVGRFAANDYGLFDVHGNVSEWTLDAYNGRLVGDALIDPQPRTKGRRIAVRGGGWEDSATRVRAASRAEVRSDTKSNSIGFRVFLAPEFN